METEKPYGSWQIIATLENITEYIDTDIIYFENYYYRIYAYLGDYNSETVEYPFHFSRGTWERGCVESRLMEPQLGLLP